MYCRFCGKEIKESAIVCSACGLSVDASEPRGASDKWPVTTMMLLSVVTFLFPPAGLFFGVRGLLDTSKKTQAGVLLCISSFQSMLMLAIVLGL